MVAKRLVRSMFGLLGFEVRRIALPNTDRHFLLPPAVLGLSKPVIVEIIGPSGIGKSSLASELAQLGDWAGSMGLSEPASSAVSPGLERDLRLLVEAKLSDLFGRLHYSFSESVDIADWLIGGIRSEVRLRENTSVSQVVLSHEGLFHLFGREIMLLMARDDPDFGSIFKDRVVISLHASPATILGRWRERELAGVRRPALLGDEESRARRLEAQLESQDEFLANLAEHGLPTLRLDASEPSRRLAELSLGWLRALEV